MYSIENIEYEEWKELKRLEKKIHLFQKYVEYVKEKADIWDIHQLCKNSETYTDFDDDFPFYINDEENYDKFKEQYFKDNYATYVLKHPEIDFTKPLMSFDFDTNSITTYTEEEAWEITKRGNLLSGILNSALCMREDIFPIELENITQEFESMVERGEIK